MVRRRLDSTLEIECWRKVKLNRNNSKIKMHGSFVSVANFTLRIIHSTIRERKIKDTECKAKGSFLSQLNAYKQNAS